MEGEIWTIGIRQHIQYAYTCTYIIRTCVQLINNIITVHVQCTNVYGIVISKPYTRGVQT